MKGGPGLPRVSGRDVVAALEHGGWKQVGQRGSHVKLRNPFGHVAIVPMHRELAPGTLASILRQAHLEPGAFLALLRG